jgi:hypothetical protein
MYVCMYLLPPLDIVLKGEETGTTSVTADRIAETIQNVSCETS